jgi:hypothetical protein
MALFFSGSVIPFDYIFDTPCRVFDACRLSSGDISAPGGLFPVMVCAGYSFYQEFCN